MLFDGALFAPVGVTTYPLQNLTFGVMSYVRTCLYEEFSFQTRSIIYILSFVAE